MKGQSISSWIKSTRTHFHAGQRLVTWHPHGIMDDPLLDEIAYFTLTLDISRDAPFDRYTDFRPPEIHLRIGHVFDIAEERKLAHAGQPPVRSAFFCDKFVGFGIARMYEALMEGTSINARAFRDRAVAAEFLGVPLQILDDPGKAENRERAQTGADSAHAA